MIGPEEDCKTSSGYAWCLVGSAGCTETDPSILKELSEFRGRMLYAEGRRPGFLRSDGRYADDDPLDSRSFHVTVRAGVDLLGYMRIRPLPEYPHSSLGRLVTKHQFDAILEKMRLTPEDCLEVSRWMVAPSARGTGLASALVISAWAVGMWLGKLGLLATVGAVQGQATMLARFGGQVLQTIPPKFIAEYDDQLAIMQFDLSCPPPRVATRLGTVRRLLQLADTAAPTGSERDSCYAAEHA